MNPFLELVELYILSAVVEGVFGSDVHFLGIFIFQFIHKELRLIKYLRNYTDFEIVSLCFFVRHSEVKFDGFSTRRLWGTCLVLTFYSGINIHNIFTNYHFVNCDLVLFNVFGINGGFMSGFNLNSIKQDLIITKGILAD